jgi:hypothetical protein
MERKCRRHGQKKIFVSVCKPEGKRPLARPRRKLEDDIKIVVEK